MKTVKILIATAILSTFFYACKKEEMNLKSSEVNLTSENQNNLTSEETLNATSGIIKVVFEKMGTMIIEGNPNLENLLTMYNASANAINSANYVFTLTEKQSLIITFDRFGNTIASDIPSVPVGSTIDAFIRDFCKVTPTSNLLLSITKNNIERNYMEFWNAMPIGAIENFEASVKDLQSKMPLGFTMQIQINPNQIVNVTVLNPNGDPIQTTSNCNGAQSNPCSFSGILKCFSNLFCWGI